MSGELVTDETRVGQRVSWREAQHTYVILTNAYEDENGNTCRVIGRGNKITLIVEQSELRTA